MGIEPELHDDDPASSTLSPVVAIPEGFLMERYNISDELAFDLLRASARAAHPLAAAAGRYLLMTSEMPRGAVSAPVWWRVDRWCAVVRVHHPGGNPAA